MTDIFKNNGGLSLLIFANLLALVAEELATKNGG